MLNAKTLAGVVAALLCSGLSVVTQAGSPVSDTQTPAPTTATPVPSTKSRCSIEIVDEHKITVDCPTTDRVRIIGVGDWGEEFIAPYVLGVRDGVTALANTGDYDFIFAVGDNFYRNGVTTTTDELWKSIWVDRWAIGTNLTLPWVTILGNHDWKGNAQAQIDYGKSNEPGAPYWIMPSKYFSLDATVKGPSKNKFKITVVDTMTINTTAEFDWAAKEYTDPSAEFVLAAGHHHLYSAAKRGDNKDAPMVRLRELVESTPSVKAYLCGHEHDMQYLRAAGKDYFMFGGSGRTMNESEVGRGTKAEIVYFKKKYGYATFDIAPAARTVDVTYYVLDNQGTNIETHRFERKY